MRIRAGWGWIPLAITVAGVVYLSMVALSRWEARRNEPPVVRDTPKPFVPPPPKTAQRPELTEAPEPVGLPVPPRPPSIPGVELPPYRLHK